MSLSERLHVVWSGFHRTFWVANGMELFERLAYYGQGTVLGIFLRNHLGLTEMQAGSVSSVFGSLIYFLPIVAGTLADKFGFRRAFSVAFFILAIGYFLIGSTGMAAFHGLYEGMNLFAILLPIMVFTAFGGAFIKPSVLGTVAVTSTPATKSFGYAVYYWLVNVGAMLGPVIANIVRKSAGIEFVYLVSAGSCALMLVVNLMFFRGVPAGAAAPTVSLGRKFLDMLTVLRNVRFILFLLIFALYWIMFWGGIYIILPFYITDFIDKNADFELVIAVAAASIIAFQLIVNQATKRLPTRVAIVVGLGTSSLCWLLIALRPTIPMIIVGMVVWSIGEMIQAPRYYEYVSDLAPPGQQAMYQGYAFLPIAIAWLVGGTFGGWLYTAGAKEAAAPAIVWFALFAIGVLATLLMWLYNALTAAREVEA